MYLDKKALVRLTWIVVAFVLFGIGVGCVWWPASQSIGQVRLHARDLYEEANQNDAIVRQASDVRASAKRIRADILAIGGERSAGAVTAALLRLLNRESMKLNVDVRTLAPATVVSPTSDPHGLVKGGSVSLGLRGPFRNVVNFIADLPRHDVLIELHDAQIASADATQRTPVLDATIDATIFRIVPNMTEDNNVRAL